MLSGEKRQLCDAQVILVHGRAFVPASAVRRDARSLIHCSMFRLHGGRIACQECWNGAYALSIPDRIDAASTNGFSLPLDRCYLICHASRRSSGLPPQRCCRSVRR